MNCSRCACRVILCSFAQERLADLKQLAEQHQLPLAHDLKTLVDERMAQDECIVICGSLYFVSEAVRLFRPQIKKTVSLSCEVKGDCFFIYLFTCDLRIFSQIFIT